MKVSKEERLPVVMLTGSPGEVKRSPPGSPPMVKWPAVWTPASSQLRCEDFERPKTYQAGPGRRDLA